MSDTELEEGETFTPHIKRWFNEGYTVGRGENTCLMLYNKIYYGYKNQPEKAYENFKNLCLKPASMYCNNFYDFPHDIDQLQAKLSELPKAESWEEHKDNLIKQADI